MSTTFSAGGLDATFSLTKGNLTAVSGSTYFYSKEIPFAGDNIGIEASVTWAARPPSGGGGFGDWGPRGTSRRRGRPGLARKERYTSVHRGPRSLRRYSSSTGRRMKPPIR